MLRLLSRPLFPMMINDPHMHSRLPVRRLRLRKRTDGVVSDAVVPDARTGNDRNDSEAVVPDAMTGNKHNDSGENRVHGAEQSCIQVASDAEPSGVHPVNEASLEPVGAELGQARQAEEVECLASQSVAAFSQCLDNASTKQTLSSFTEIDAELDSGGNQLSSAFEPGGGSGQGITLIDATGDSIEQFSPDVHDVFGDPIEDFSPGEVPGNAMESGATSGYAGESEADFDLLRLDVQYESRTVPVSNSPGLGIDFMKWSLPVQGPKFFWEEDEFLSSIFCDPTTRPSRSKRPADFIPVPDEGEPIVEAFSRAKHSRVGALCEGAFKHVQKRDDDGKRQPMGSNWASLVCMGVEAFSVSRALLAEGPDITHSMVVDSVLTCMSKKATATISKRFYAMNRFVGYCARNGLQSFPLCERVVYQYLKSLRDDEQSAATSGRSFLESVNFARGTLGLQGDLDNIGFRRIDGIAAEIIQRGGPVEQSKPLTVNQVMMLEKMVVDCSDLRDKLILGSMLILLYGTARVSDGQRARKYILDVDLEKIDPASMETQGFFEMQVLGSKTARTEALRRFFLPVVAPIFSLSGADWFRTWLQARETMGLEWDGPPSVPLLCRFDSSGKPLNQEATSAEVTKVLRSALRVPSEDFRFIRSHSLKCTLLSWCCKAAVSLDLRRLLGHHLDPSSASPEAYSRDSMAPAVQALVRVLGMVKSGTFMPDQTRSGRFVQTQAAEPLRHISDDDDEDPSDEYEPSEASSDSSVEEVSGPADSSLLWHLVEFGLRPDFHDVGENLQVFRNNVSGMQHLKPWAV